jgi:hypothetical protein
MNQEMSHAFARSDEYNVTLGTQFMNPEYCFGTTLLSHTVNVILLWLSHVQTVQISNTFSDMTSTNTNTL